MRISSFSARLSLPCKLFKASRALSSTTIPIPDLYKPPTKPLNFGRAFKIQKLPDDLPLAILNSHPLDSQLRFEDVEHVYTFNGTAIKMSVTSIIEQYFEKFNPDAAANMMISGNNWPREGYCDKNGNPMTIADIKRKWEYIGLAAANYGTWVHHIIERYLNDLPTCDDEKEMEKFKIFRKDIIDTLGAVPYRTEWRIVAPNEMIAGSVDFVGKLPDGTFVLMDWKTSKAIDERLTSKFNRKAGYPIHHLDDCEGSKYFLQLNMYRYILQKYYDMEVSKMILTSFHDNYSPYFHTDVPVLESEIEAIIQDYTSGRQAYPSNF